MKSLTNIDIECQLMSDIELHLIVTKLQKGNDEFIYPVYPSNGDYNGLLHTEIGRCMLVKYGDKVSKCENMIIDINNILLDLSDEGFLVTVGFAPNTIICRDESPKIVVDVVSTISAMNFSFTEYIGILTRVKSYVTGEGYVFGDGFNPPSIGRDPDSLLMDYKMLIQ